MHHRASEIFVEAVNELCRFLGENISLMEASDFLCQETAQCDFELQEEDCVIVDDKEVVIDFCLSVLSSLWEGCMNLSHLFCDHLDHDDLEDSIYHFLAREWVDKGHHQSGLQVDSFLQHRNTRRLGGHLYFEEGLDL